MQGRRGNEHIAILPDPSAIETAELVRKTGLSMRQVKTQTHIRSRHTYSRWRES